MTRADAEAAAGEGANARSEADAVDRAVEAFRAGRPVLVHDADDREGETDLLYPATAVDPAAVVRMRADAGGLLFVALGSEVADAFDLPFLHEAIDHPAAEFDDLGYDSRPSFSLSVNHRDTYTGITDEDRALTVRSLGEAAADPEGTDFAAAFRSPGHVHVLRAAAGLLDERLGHTELGIALAEAAGLPAAVAGAEMLDADTGRALAPAAAREYAAANDLVYVEGADLIERLG
ncbi:3,4-dihydroxy-2-butanone-4-phosphate synthase [Halobacteriales archaeon QS_8_69_26]|nr:MAG: 3,4-dihydroxy-2-butanone-4-phosphate synthase [Halobacteriales archaeon QS_8_69_26]